MLGEESGLQANERGPIIRIGKEVAKQSPRTVQLNILPIPELRKEVALGQGPSLPVRFP